MQTVPCPHSMLIECLDIVLPTLTQIVEDSLTSSIFPQIHKSAVVKPLLKKPTLDHNDLKNNSPCVKSFFSVQDHRFSFSFSNVQSSLF